MNIMLRQTGRRNAGFTMVEVLIAFVIVTVGLLAIGVLQSTVINSSADSKVRNEALTVSEGVIEAYRNLTYQNADFNNWLTSVQGASGVQTVTGDLFDYTVLSEFYREDPDNPGQLESVTIAELKTELANGDPVEQKVILKLGVIWDAAYDADNAIADYPDDTKIVIDTELNYADPRTMVVNLGALSESLIDSPAGRAKIGEGTVIADAQDMTPNSDGTATVQQGEDLLLVDQDQLSGGEEDEHKVLLTLEEACVSGVCTGFVQISGRVYVDTDEVRNFDFEDLFVKASDASYCRLWKEGADDPDDLSTPYSTPDGDYDFVAYTCYLGGGWYGNIGILLADGIQLRDKICQGDPNAAQPSNQPVIALRRAYRGLLTLTASPTTFASVGIADATSLNGHDFVLTDMAASRTAGHECIDQGTLVRDDSQYTRSSLLTTPSDSGVDGKLFEGNPPDFYCLNNGGSGGSELIDGSAQDATNYYVDVDGTVISALTVPATCAYDPTGGFANTYDLEVTVTFPSAISSDANTFTIETSDGPNNCVLYDGDGTNAHVYRCTVFDGGNGWDGTINVTDNGGFSCSPSELTFSNVSGTDGDVISSGTISCSN
ncbi:MAG: hypothetical protein CMI01_11985 [Oceanospirillaceae bacterium]|nr:hypothetical protein [Oceanospirillaceae bacterium]